MAEKSTNTISTSKKIDMERSVFLSDGFFVYYNKFGFGELKIPEELQTLLRFSGAAVTPGSYALVYRSYEGRFSSGIEGEDRCFTLAPVFNVIGGSINILGVINANKPEGTAYSQAAESQSKLVVEGYPKLSAAIRPAELLGIATFEPKKQYYLGKSHGCGELNGVEISLLPSK